MAKIIGYYIEKYTKEDIIGKKCTYISSNKESTRHIIIAKDNSIIYTITLDEYELESDDELVSRGILEVSIVDKNVLKKITHIPKIECEEIYMN